MIFLKSIFLISLCSLTTTIAEQLYHREGRFINFSVHRYKTQLPSIHDIANTFIHYRMPVAVIVPYVNLNIRPKQRRTHFANFPTTAKAVSPPKPTQSDSPNKIVTVTNEQESKSNKQVESVPATPIIDRTGWTARSLTKPKSYYSLSNYKLRSLNDEQAKRKNLNYANANLAESNVDIIPFIYKEHLPNQVPSNIFNSPYQLNNPNNVFSQNIAYYQPNSLAPFQPNILLLTTPEQIATNQIKTDNQSVTITQKQSDFSLLTTNANNSIRASLSSTPNQVDQSINHKPINQAKPENSTFDVSQVNDNPDEIVQEHVQNHEPVENVPVSPVVNSVEDSNNSSVDSAIVAANNSIIHSAASLNDQSSTIINNSTNTSTSNAEPIETVIVDKPQTDLQSISQPLANELTLINPLRSNLVKRFYTYPQTNFFNHQIRPKNSNIYRSHRSLPIDMPSYASLITAAVAQSGHSSQDRKMMFNQFINENLNQ